MKGALGICLLASAVYGQLRTDVIHTKFIPTLYSLRKPVPVLFEARVGPSIDSVTICLPCALGQTAVRVNLNDQGTGGDRVAGDRTFSITLQPFDLNPFITLAQYHTVSLLLEAYNGQTRIISLSASIAVLKDAPHVNVVQENNTTQYSRNLVNMQVTDAEFFGGFQNAMSVARRFYTMFGDDFDMLNIVYEGSLFQNRTHQTAQNQMRGIGVGINNGTANWGSAGKLLGVNRFPIDSLFDVDRGRTGGRAFLHETGHQWISFLPDPLLVGGNPHWPVSDLATGIMGFSDPVNRQGLGISGEFVAEGSNYRLTQSWGIESVTFQDLELYLMGMLAPSGVQPHFVFRNQNQLGKLAAGGLVDGPVDTFTINDVIANNGVRVPDVAGAQKTFRMATIYLTIGRLATADEMAYYDHATTLMDGQFNRATRGVGHINPMVKDIAHYPPATRPEIHWVGTASSGPVISRNGWIEIKGIGLAPPSAGAGVVWSNAPEFAQGRMPTSLEGVRVRINGRDAYVYFVSPNQVNVLAPLDGSTGTVNVEVTNGSQTSDPFSVPKAVSSPSFFYFGATNYIAATHADGSLLGPASMSVPGFVFTPARAGETIVLYGAGFGPTQGALVEGAAAQSGTLPVLPGVQFGNATGAIRFAGLVSPGLYQFNAIVPPGIPPGDVAIRMVSSGGVVTGLIALAP